MTELERWFAAEARQFFGIDTSIEFKFEHPAQREHGHYATPVCMQLFKVLSAEQKTALSANTPRFLADTFVTHLRESGLPEFVEKIAVAGPGFINITITSQFLATQLLDWVSQGLPQLPQTGKKYVVEFSSPNIAKPFTVGHLRSTIIGDSLARILTRMGHTVFRDNHLGDWGTQFGKLVYAIKTWGNEAEIEASQEPVKILVDLYVKFHAEAEKEPSLDEAGRAWFKKLETGDPEARRLWQKCIDWSWKEFDRLYRRLDITFTENDGRGYGESYFESMMPAVLAELKQKNLLADSQGAKVIFLDQAGLPPLMVEKSDGATLYATRDLATDSFRRTKYGPDVIIVNEVGGEQSLYFRQLFEVERLLGWYRSDQRIHVAHGHYRFKSGKMSTRKGQVVWLEDVLQEAFSRVKLQANQEIPEEDTWKIALGAIKWQDLKRESHLDITFDYEEMLSLTGNAGPYLMYTVVRASSVLEKVVQQRDIAEYIDIFRSHFLSKVGQEKAELASNPSFQQYFDILFDLSTYFEVIERSASEYAPHHLATYLFSLAQRFNTLYAQEPIAQEPDEVKRACKVLITDAMKMVITDGLGLLGISTVSKM